MRYVHKTVDFIESCTETRLHVYRLRHKGHVYFVVVIVDIVYVSVVYVSTLRTDATCLGRR